MRERERERERERKTEKKQIGRKFVASRGGC